MSILQPFQVKASNVIISSASFEVLSKFYVVSIKHFGMSCYSFKQAGFMMVFCSALQINQLKQENSELKREIESWKSQLVDAEKANGIPQIPPPVRGQNFNP